MFSFVWPIALVVLSNTVYHICSKNIPNNANAFLSLTITYLIGAVFTFFMFLVSSKEHNLVKEFSKINWAPFVLGIAIVGLEIGFLFAYKAGWQVSTASIVQSSFLAVVLVIVGFLLYHEPLSRNKIIGIIICLIGLIFVNLK